MKNGNEQIEKQGHDLGVLAGSYGPTLDEFTAAELFRKLFIIKLSRGEERSFSH